jgi:hypothetical protein
VRVVRPPENDMDPVAALKLVMDPDADTGDRHEAAVAYNQWVAHGGFRATLDGRPVQRVRASAHQTTAGQVLLAIVVDFEFPRGVVWFYDDRPATHEFGTHKKSSV